MIMKRMRSLFGRLYQAALSGQFSEEHARRALHLGIFAGFCVSFVQCLTLDSASSTDKLGSDELKTLVQTVLSVYVPMLSLMVGMYIGDIVAPEKPTAPADAQPVQRASGVFSRTLFLVLIVMSYAMFPVFLLHRCACGRMNVKEVMDWIAALRPYSDGVSMLALGYLFGKTPRPTHAAKSPDAPVQ